MKPKQGGRMRFLAAVAVLVAVVVAALPIAQALLEDQAGLFDWCASGGLHTVNLHPLTLSAHGRRKELVGPPAFLKPLDSTRFAVASNLGAVAAIEASTGRLGMA